MLTDNPAKIWTAFVLVSLKLAVIVRMLNRLLLSIPAEFLNILNDERRKDSLSGAGYSMYPEESRHISEPILVIRSPYKPLASVVLMQLTGSVVVR